MFGIKECLLDYTLDSELQYLIICTSYVPLLTPVFILIYVCIVYVYITHCVAMMCIYVYMHRLLGVHLMKEMMVLMSLTQR